MLEDDPYATIRHLMNRSDHLSLTTDPTPQGGVPKDWTHSHQGTFLIYSGGKVPVPCAGTMQSHARHGLGPAYPPRGRGREHRRRSRGCSKRKRRSSARFTKARAGRPVSGLGSCVMMHDRYIVEMRPAAHCHRAGQQERGTDPLWNPIWHR